jgi:hypothetical protein
MRLGCATISRSIAWLWHLSRTIARLRSRIGWIKDGDANTTLFHASARYRKGKNFIASLTSREGQILTAHEDNAVEFEDFYNGLPDSHVSREVTIDLDALGVPSYELAQLEAPFSEEEVWDTIKRLPSDKVSGPDSFTRRFYKTCWPIIKNDIMAAISCVWARKFRNMRAFNSAFITLLPKLQPMQYAKDYRPISLVHSFAKLVTKVLANQLAGRLHEMVSTNQSAFIKKRFIKDNFMLVQQTTQFLHQQEQPRILFKLDISKAFDSVSWAFLLEVLKKMGFDTIWCDMISSLLATSSTQILMNRVPGGFIAHQRGLRQGDPLSPILFILVMDILARLVQKASEDGFLQPLVSRRLRHRIPLYADDVVLFFKSDAADINLVIELLSLFGKASGLHTNLQKSSVVPIRCDTQIIAAAKELFHCEFADFPCKYLGLPLSIKKLTRAQIQSIIDKVASSLPGWMAELMNRAGRAVHAQFVMAAKVIYTSIAVDLPLWAVKAIEKILRDFLWKGRKEAKGVTVC